jgi:hypothetical protein
MDGRVYALRPKLTRRETRAETQRGIFIDEGGGV